MAEYDSTPPATFDSGLTYDTAPLPPPIKRMGKIKVKLNLDGKNGQRPADVRASARGSGDGQHELHHAAAGSDGVHHGLDGVSNGVGQFNTAQAAAKQATQVKDTARAALESALTQRGNYVELTAASAADPVAVIESAGFSAKSASVPSGVPDMVQNLSLTPGDNAGEIDAQWDPVAGVKINYDLHWSPYPATDTSWKDCPGTTKSKAVLTGFTSGQQILVRVRAKGSGGTGAWSQSRIEVCTMNKTGRDGVPPSQIKK